MESRSALYESATTKMKFCTKEVQMLHAATTYGPVNVQRKSTEFGASEAPLPPTPSGDIVKTCREGRTDYVTDRDGGDAGGFRTFRRIPF